MAQAIRKLAASVSLGYADGSEAATLLGTNFLFDAAGDGGVFCIDLSGNLSARNRALPCYAEAQAFQDKHGALASCRVGDGEVANALSAALRQESPVRLELQLGDASRYSYEAMFHADERSAYFSVRPESQAASRR